MSRFKNSLILGIIFLISLSTCSSALSFKEYTCPEIKPIENLNATAFLNTDKDGLWYVIARYPNEMDQDNKCMIYKLTRTSDSVRADVVSLPKDSEDAVSMLITFPPNNRGTLLLDMSHGSPVKNFKFDEHILVIDYDHFYISYECKYDEKTNLWNEYSWIVSTTKKPDAAVKTAINEFITSSNVLDANKYEWLDLDDINCKIRDH